MENNKSFSLSKIFNLVLWIVYLCLFLGAVIGYYLANHSIKPVSAGASLNAVGTNLGVFFLMEAALAISGLILLLALGEPLKKFIYIFLSIFVLGSILIGLNVMPDGFNMLYVWLFYIPIVLVFLGKIIFSNIKHPTE